MRHVALPQPVGHCHRQQAAMPGSDAPARGYTLKDLCSQDKKKVAKLIKQVGLTAAARCRHKTAVPPCIAIAWL